MTASLHFLLTRTTAICRQYFTFLKNWNDNCRIMNVNFRTPEYVCFKQAGISKQRIGKHRENSNDLYQARPNRDTFNP